MLLKTIHRFLSFWIFHLLYFCIFRLQLIEQITCKHVLVRVSKTLAGYNVGHQCYDCLFFKLFDRFAFQFWIMINIPKKQKFWLISQVYLRG